MDGANGNLNRRNRMQLGKEIPTRQFNKWMKALRSGEYSQTVGQLQDSKGYCCLGVACRVVIEKEKIIHLCSTSNLYGGFPASQPGSPKWLKEIGLDFEDRVGLSLVYVNDNQELSFDEIADTLEAVYVHKVLD